MKFKLSVKAVCKLLIIALLVGDCVVITKGIFKNSIWTILQVNTDGTYDIEYSGTTIRGVRGSYLQKLENGECK